ncbi:hypothetical protein ACOMHN_018136 [Nucella lapillus]
MPRIIIKRDPDEKPIHNFCLLEWCPYKKAEAAGTLDTFTHQSTLPEAVMAVIKPVFTDLAKTELLRKCVQGYTQNANEIINNLVWKFCPKIKNHGITTVNTAVALAVCIFNDGATLLEAVLNRMNIEAGDFAKTFFAHKDTYRILTSQT